MRHIAITLLLALAAATSQEAGANPLVESTQRCLADNTTGKERKELARWVFLGMSVHPEIRDLAAAPSGAAEQASQYVGKLITRLIVENCPREIGNLVKQAGPQSLQVAFQFLGQVAMQELMTDPNVSKVLSGFERYIDREKVTAVVQPK